jgi:hypothetical protein
MDYKVKLTKCQNEHPDGGVFDTWTKWAKPHAKWAQGPAGQPISLADRLGFELARPEAWLTRLYISSQGRIRGLKAVDAEKSGWPATWMVERLSISSKPTLPSLWRPPFAPI